MLLYKRKWYSSIYLGLERWIESETSEKKSLDPAHGSESGESHPPPVLGDGEEFIPLGSNRTIKDIKQAWHTNKNAENKDSENPQSESVEIPQNVEVSTGEAKPEDKNVWSKERLMKETRRFNLDLTPRLLYARYFLSILIDISNIQIKTSL